MRKDEIRMKQSYIIVFKLINDIYNIMLYKCLFYLETQNKVRKMQKL